MKRIIIYTIYLLALIPCYAVNQENNPLNKIDFTTLTIMDKEVKYNTNKPYMKINYKMYEINISIIERGDESSPMNSTIIFEDIEKSVLNDPNNIKKYFFNKEPKLVKINNQHWIDSIVLSMFEAEDQQFTRRMITTLNDKFIVIDITLNDEFSAKIFEEVPEYFKERNGYRIWNSTNNKEFLSKLINGSLESATVEMWFNDTIKISQSIIINN